METAGLLHPKKNADTSLPSGSHSGICQAFPLKPLLIMLICLLMILLTAVPGSAVIIGIVSDEPLDALEKFDPLARYIEKHVYPETSDTAKSRVIVEKTLRKMAENIKNGRADLFIDSPFPALFVNYLSGSRFLVRRWKKRNSQYHTVIFCRKDSGISQLEDLKGKTIAFENLSSSSSYMLPKMVLQQKGFVLSRLNDAFSKPEPEEVGYRFSGHDENTMVWVLRKQADAGAMNALSFKNEAKQQVNELKVLYRTFSIPRHVVCIRGDYPLQKAEAVKNCLMDMEKSAEGRKILEHIQKTTRFDEIPKEDLENLNHMIPFIAAELDAQ